MTNLLVCPFCSSSGGNLTIKHDYLPGIDDLSGFFFVFCWCCEMHGPLAHSERLAEIAWNDRQKEKAPEAATSEALNR